VVETGQSLLVWGDPNHFSGPTTRFSGSEPETLPSDSLVRNELAIELGLMERETHSFPTTLISNPDRFSE
jgi:hypothetical protein